MVCKNNFDRLRLILCCSPERLECTSCLDCSSSERVVELVYNQYVSISSFQSSPDLEANAKANKVSTRSEKTRSVLVEDSI